MGWYSVIIGALLMVMAAAQVGAPQPPPRRFVAGEVIVRFFAETDAGARIARATSHGTEIPSTEVSAYVSSLGRDLGVPLDAKRLGSGGTLVVGIRQPDLPETLAAKLRRQPSISTAQPTATLPASDAAVLVEFVAGSREASVLSKLGGSVADRDRALTELTDKIERAIGLAINGHIDAVGRLVLKPDLDQLTLQLVERLSKRKDVEYAQPNYISRVYR